MSAHPISEAIATAMLVELGDGPLTTPELWDRLTRQGFKLTKSRLALAAKYARACGFNLTAHRGGQTRVGVWALDPAPETTLAWINRQSREDYSEAVTAFRSCQRRLKEGDLAPEAYALLVQASGDAQSRAFNAARLADIDPVQVVRDLHGPVS